MGIGQGYIGTIRTDDLERFSEGLYQRYRLIGNQLICTPTPKNTGEVQISLIDVEHDMIDKGKHYLFGFNQGAGR